MTTVSRDVIPPLRRTAAAKTQTQWMIVLRELRRNRGTMIGVIALALLILIAICAPILTPYDPIKVVSRDTLAPPSARHLFGADRYGRDILSRILFGARISLAVGLISVGIGVAVGVPLGLIAGWAGGWPTRIIMRLTDAMLAMPGLLLALSIVAALGPGLTHAMIAVGIAAIPTYIRLVWSGVLSVRELAYVDAARLLGCSSRRIIFRHILPNVVAPVVVVASLGMGTAIIAAAGLSFLGLGAEPPTPEWGASVSDGRDVLATAWWISTFPSLAIMVTVLAINLVGDGLRDAFDPRLRRR